MKMGNGKRARGSADYLPRELSVACWTLFPSFLRSTRPTRFVIRWLNARRPWTLEFPRQLLVPDRAKFPSRLILETQTSPLKIRQLTTSFRQRDTFPWEIFGGTTFVSFAIDRLRKDFRYRCFTFQSSNWEEREVSDYLLNFQSSPRRR